MGRARGRSGGAAAATLRRRARRSGAAGDASRASARAADLRDSRPLREQLLLVQVPDGLGEEGAIHLLGAGAGAAAGASDAVAVRALPDEGKLARCSRRGTRCTGQRPPSGGAARPRNEGFPSGPAAEGRQNDEFSQQCARPSRRRHPRVLLRALRVPSLWRGSLAPCRQPACRTRCRIRRVGPHGKEDANSPKEYRRRLRSGGLGSPLQRARAETRVIRVRW